MLLFFSCSNELYRKPTRTVTIKIYNIDFYDESFIPYNKFDFNYLLKAEFYNENELYRSRNIDLLKDEDDLDFELELDKKYSLKAYLYNKSNGSNTPIATYGSEEFIVEDRMDINLNEISRTSNKIGESEIYELDLDRIEKSVLSGSGNKKVFKVGNEEWYSFIATSSMSKVILEQDGYSVSLAAKDDKRLKSTFRGLFLYTTPGETFFFREQSTYATVKVEPYTLPESKEQSPIISTLNQDIKSTIDNPEVFKTYQFKIKQNYGYIITTDTPVRISPRQSFESGKNTGYGFKLFKGDKYYFYLLIHLLQEFQMTTQSKLQMFQH